MQRWCSSEGIGDFLKILPSGLLAAHGPGNPEMQTLKDLVSKVSAAQKEAREKQAETEAEVAGKLAEADAAKEAELVDGSCAPMDTSVTGIAAATGTSVDIQLEEVAD